MIHHPALIAEARTAWRTFVRRRTAVVFTFVFPLLLVVIFGALVTTDPGDGGLFTEPTVYYVPGYLAVVVMFTPLSRIGAEVIRHRDANRFEQLSTTPLSRADWLLAHTLVNIVLVGFACAIVLGVLWVGTGVAVRPSLGLVLFIAVGVTMFCGIGACLGRVASTQDGVIAAANTLAIPMLLLAETFVPPRMLPAWFQPFVDVMPLTPFSRGVRTVVEGGAGWGADLLLLAVLALVFLVIGAHLLPRVD